MANPFDQFDTTNPFDQFDPAQAPAQSPPSTMDYLMAGPGGAMMQPIERAGQQAIRLPMHLLSTLSDLGGLYPNALATALRGATSNVDDWVNNQNQDYANARAKFQNPASEPIYGTIGSTVPAMIAGELAGPAAVAKSLGGNVVNGAMQGARAGGIMGALQNADTSQGQNYWGQTAGNAATGALSGAVTGAAVNAGAPQATPPPPATDFKSQSNALYKEAKDAGVVVKNDSLKNFSDNLTNTVAEEGLSKRSHPDALASLMDIQDASRSGQPITLKGLDLLRQNIGDVAATAKTAGERRIAGIMRDQMDTYMNDQLGPNDVIAGDPQSAFHVLSQARDLWNTYKKSAAIDQMVENAKNNAGANYSQAGYETALRQQFRALANNPARMRGFSPDEQDAILSVVRGGPVDNAMRSIGRFVTRGPVSGMLTMAATALGGPPAGIAMTAAAEGARALATRGTMSNIDNLQNLIKGYSDQPPPASIAGTIAGNPSILLRMLQTPAVNAAIPPLLYAGQKVGR